MNEPDKYKRRSIESAALSAKEDIGSSMPEQVEYLIIGRVVATRGLRGELKVQIETEDPGRFQVLDNVYLGDSFTPFRVQGVRFHKGQALLQLYDIDDRETAEGWRNAWVYVHIDDVLPLAEGEYYFYQLEGLTVVTEAAELLGTLVEVLPTGANDVYVIKGDHGELLLPALRDVVINIDLESRTMTVRVPDGLG